MTGRFALSLIALAAGVALASFVPGLSQSLRSVVGLAPGELCRRLGDEVDQAAW